MDLIEFLQNYIFHLLIERETPIKLISINEDNETKLLLQEQWNYKTDYLWKKYYYKEIKTIDFINNQLEITIEE